jgi:hypothetical protein
MIEIYIVYVQDDLNNRFIDSMWASSATANQRAAQLKANMSSGQFKGTSFVKNGVVEDVQIVATAEHRLEHDAAGADAEV